MYIFRKSVKKRIDDATKLFDKSSTVKGKNLLSKISHCAPSDIEEQPEYIDVLAQDLITEMEEIKSKQKILQSLHSYKSTSHKNTSKRTLKRKKTSKKSSKKQSKN